jgi:8-oxo-dGTP pyrophosphatase MutT (NUDIX family)
MRTDAVIGLVYDSSKTHILLVKRRDVPIWVLPGGGVDPGEKPQDAVIREVLEETGLHVKVVKKIAEYTPINTLAKYTETYECETLWGDLLTGEETEEVGFFSIKNLPNNFFFLHGDWLLDSLSNDPNIIKKPLTQVSYYNLIKYFLKHPIWVLRFFYTLTFKH